MDLDFLEIFSQDRYCSVNLILRGLPFSRTVPVLRVLPAVFTGISFLKRAWSLTLVLVARGVVELADVADVQEIRVVGLLLHALRFVSSPVFFFMRHYLVWTELLSSFFLLALTL